MSDIIDRLEEACKGYPAAWPHRLLHDAISEIERLRGVAQAPLRSAAERYMTAVKRLAEESGYNRLTYFEAPILDMPTEETKREAHARWMGLNNAGVELTKALAVPSTEGK